MKEFFKPWRRKFGVLTLMLACVAVCGWVRSYTTADDIVFLGGKLSYEDVGSFNGSVGWWHHETDGGVGFANKVLQWKAFPLNEFISSDYDLYVTWHLDVSGFRYGRYIPTGTFKATCLVIPYWSLVIPLTFLSAYLLLKKPQTSTSKKTPEPTANEGGAS